MLPYYARYRQPLSPIRVPAPEAAAPGPDGPARPRRRPHEPKTLDRVRELYEGTRLTVRAIAVRAGVSAATVSRQARRAGWLRPDAGYPAEHFSAEGRRKLRRGAIAEALLRQAEHLLFRQEMDPNARRRQIAETVRLVRAARALDEEERPPPPGGKRRKP